MENPNSLPPVTTGNNPAPSLPVLFAVTGAAGKVTLQTSAPAPIVKGAKRSPFAKRTGKAAKRPGFAVWETIKWLAAAAIVWGIYGAIVFALMFYATR
jgi:hypothetical protein